VNFEQHQQAFTAALRAGDELAARSVVDQARDVGADLAAIYLQIFAPSMVTIGELWERNELNVAEEHLATAITERLVGMLSPDFAEAAPRSPGTVVLGCVEGERHALGLRMLADLFRRQGWQVLYLGADVPTRDWVGLAVRYRATAAAISVAMTQNLVAVRALVAELRATLPGLIILVGGTAFAFDPQLWQKVGATLYRDDPVDAVALATEQALRSVNTGDEMA